MNEIQKAFQKRKAFIAFLTAGDPDLQCTPALMEALEDGGVDLIEIGIPFSDPTAEGPVIQAADARALAAGCNLDRIFAMLRNARQKISVPLVLMTYYNPVFAYGQDRFLQQCAKIGIDGLIVPDVPFEEKGDLVDDCRRHAVTLISMIAPTSKERTVAIAREAEGFIYCVSSLGVTGVRQKIHTDLSQMVESVRSVSSIPCAVGFGISTPAQAKTIAQVADGVIIGSAVVKIIAKHGTMAARPLQSYAQSIRQALDCAASSPAP